ncbi:MAG: hypothetical protein BWZ07_03326 [Alphaproteobacteria bacterium ADurb.BinA280]|nr:MAG: hypothetical protein BWZ07_03326 [Alphaproteobacteria bacterium ADurb.BinA280]
MAGSGIRYNVTLARDCALSPMSAIHRTDVPESSTPRPIASKSRATTPVSPTSATIAQVLTLMAKMRAWSPESLCVQRMSGCNSELVRPLTSGRRGLLIVHIVRVRSTSGAGVVSGGVTGGLIFLQATLMRLRRTRRLVTEDFFVCFSARRSFLHFAGATTARGEGAAAARVSVETAAAWAGGASSPQACSGVNRAVVATTIKATLTRFGSFMRSPLFRCQRPQFKSCSAHCLGGTQHGVNDPPKIGAIALFG